MIEIISFPFDGRTGQRHQRALAQLEKTHWVGTDADKYLAAVGEPFVLPELMFIDFMCVENIEALALRDQRFRHLLEVSAVMIAEIDSFSFCKKSKLNIIGRMGVFEQNGPESFARFIAAYEQAKIATDVVAPDRPVTRETFERALAATP